MSLHPSGLLLCCDLRPNPSFVSMIVSISGQVVFHPKTGNRETSHVCFAQLVQWLVKWWHDWWLNGFVSAAFLGKHFFLVYIIHLKLFQRHTILPLQLIYYVILTFRVTVTIYDMTSDFLQPSLNKHQRNIQETKVRYLRKLKLQKFKVEAVGVQDWTLGYAEQNYSNKSMARETMEKGKSHGTFL